MNKTDFAYAAGIMDGEGTISIVDASPTNVGGQSWKLQLSIRCCSKKILDKVSGVLGGYVALKNPREIEHYRQFVWNLYGKKAYQALKKIKPYLTEKKAQADIGMQFYIHQSHCIYYRGKKLSPAIIEKRKSFQQRLKNLYTAFLIPNAPAETECKDTVMGEATVRPS